MHITVKRTNTYLIHALISLFICLLCCGTIIKFPPHKSLTIKTLNDISELNELSPDNYVNLKIDKLYYSGLDSKDNNNTNGHYYYNITNNKCTIFLLSDKSVKKYDKNTTPQVIADYSFQGKIMNDDDFNTKVKVYFANQINWYNYEFSKMAYPYLVSEITPNQEIPVYLTVTLTFFTLIFLFISFVNLVMYFKKRKYRQSDRHS